MQTVYFVPPATNIGVRGIFQSLKEEVPSLYLFQGSFEKGVGPVLLGVAPTIHDVERARERRAYLLSQGIASAAIVLLLFQSGLPGGLPHSIIEEELGPFTSVFPYDPQLFVRIENEKTTLQRFRPSSSVAETLRRLAATIKTQLAVQPARNGETNKEAWASALEKKTISKIWETLSGADGLKLKSNGALETAVENEFQVILSSTVSIGASKNEIDQVRQNVKDHVLGLGPLQKMMRDPLVTEIMVNGESDIYVERNGRIEKTGDSFSSRTQLLTVIDRVVAGGGRRVDVSSPLCDARLSDGSRVNVVLPPISLQGPVLTMRRFRDNLLSLNDLQEKGTLTAAQGEKLRQHVIERLNIVIAGNSGSGKTTLLNILSGFIEPSERIVTIEDSAELKLQQPHVVRLETRPPNADGVGAIGVGALVVNALRMRPDRLVIGECRGVEVIPMLQAMNTGHDGSMTTVHSNSAKDALCRLESMVLMGAAHWPIDVVRDQIKSAIDLVVFLKRSGAERKLVEMLRVEDFYEKKI